jgi:hypothetical protein
LGRAYELHKEGAQSTGKFRTIVHGPIFGPVVCVVSEMILDQIGTQMAESPMVALRALRWWQLTIE